MPKKYDKGGPKDIANKAKSKGMQKLRWYCQMCQKQCRDANGFKCHIISESHQRQLLLFADAPDTYLNEFSSDFEKGFMDIVRQQYACKRVKANHVYGEYIRNKNHIHMNATKWHTLSGFCQYLGRSNQCKVEMTDQGWFITYIDKELQLKQERLLQKVKADKDDEERMSELINEQARRAMEQAKERDGENAERPSYTEYRKLEAEKIVMTMKTHDGGDDAGAAGSSKHDDQQDLKSIHPMSNALIKLETITLAARNKRTSSSSHAPSTSSHKKSALDEIREEEEQRRERDNRKDYWLHKGIVVKIVTKKLGDEYYKQKAEVVDVKDTYTAFVRVVGQKDVLKLDQSHVETVIPSVNKRVMIVNGAYRGCKSTLKSINVDKFCCTVKIDEGLYTGRSLENVDYEDVCKLAT